MMSYLWILLLGSLLATSAKAQDDVAPKEEAAGDLETPAPEADTEPELNGEPDAEEETEHTTEEVSQNLLEAEPTADTATMDSGLDAEPTAPAGDDADPAPAGDDADDVEPTPAGDDADDVEPTPAGDDADDAEPTPAVDDADDAEPTPAVDDADDVEPTPAVDDADDVEPTPAVEDTEPTPADDDAEPAAPADGDTQPSTPVVDTEAEAAATTKEPAADPEVDDPEVKQTAVNVEEEPSASTDATPAEEEESGPDDKPTSETDPAVDDNENEPTEPATDADAIVPGVRKEVKAAVPNDDLEDDVLKAGGFNLEDALSEPNPHPGKGRSFDSGAHFAGAQGNADKPQAGASSGTLAGILCAIGVAAVGAVSGYFTYQRKKLCFKNRQEADPEAARKADAAEAQSDPQVLSNLLNSS